MYEHISAKTGSIICGLDEAGRGALAGPLVACGVALDQKRSNQVISEISPLKDSKLLTVKQREGIYEKACRMGIIFTTTVITVRVINIRGIGYANRQIFRKLIRSINADSYIVDGNLKLGSFRKPHKFVRSVIRADTRIIPVILAGIIAKVTRDRIMNRISKKFPDYGWSHNAGYGTALHINALKNYGPTIHHRTVYIMTALSHSLQKT